jgi:hypothetical protein
MPATLSRLNIWFAAACAVLAMAFAIATPGQAAASSSTYCGNQTLSNYGWCNGADRTLYQVYGWGDSHSVCVFVRWPGQNGGPGGACSSGPGAGVYSPVYNTQVWTPAISDNAAGSTVVHGVAYQP